MYYKHTVVVKKILQYTNTVLHMQTIFVCKLCGLHLLFKGEVNTNMGVHQYDEWYQYKLNEICIHKHICE